MFSLRDVVTCFAVFAGTVALFSVGAFAQSLGVADARAPEADGGDPADAPADPYVVFVAQGEAYARCGPSGDYYRTDPLRHGQELDVYVETDDGWLGIRPPGDSFSWVPADAVDLSDTATEGTVLEDRTVSWIGTHLGRARRYRWQVQLAEGETVTVIGRSERDGPDGPQLWYRIVPPSGEFRWVHRDQIVETSEELVASIAAATSPAEAPPETTRPRRSVQPRERTNRDGRPADSAMIENDRERREPAIGDEPRPRSPARSGLSDALSRPVGSGLRRASDADQRRAALSERTDTAGSDVDLTADRVARVDATSASFVSRPRLLEIGAGDTAPRSTEVATDGNWVGGGARPRGPAAELESAGVRPVSGQSRLVPHDLLRTASSGAGTSSLMPTHAPLLRTLRTVSADAIAKVNRETRDADIEKLQLVFSRLVADGASSAEVAPVRESAERLVSSTASEVIAGRARLLGERVDQYQRIARRRDGETVIRSESAPPIPTPGGDDAVHVGHPSASHSTPTTPPPSIPAAPLAGHPRSAPMPTSAETHRNTAETSQIGTLVAVYSGRANSPPFALTDRGGNTLAYVTPAPGVSLNSHLNSRVRVAGRSRYLQGLNTPLLTVRAVERTPE